MAAAAALLFIGASVAHPACQCAEGGGDPGTGRRGRAEPFDGPYRGEDAHDSPPTISPPLTPNWISSASKSGGSSAIAKMASGEAGRVAVMDGTSTVLLVRPNTG